MKQKKILILSSQFDKSVDGVINIIRKQGIELTRVNTDSIPSLTSLAFSIDNFSISGSYFSKQKKNNIEDYSSIWHRHPGKPVPEITLLKGKERDFVKEETLLASEGFWISNEDKSFWVSKPSKIKLSSYRINQLNTARKIGFIIPKTLITNRPQDVLAFYGASKNGIIAKAVGVGIPLKNKEGYNYYEVIYTKKLKKNDILDRFDSIKYAPSIFQEYIEKEVELRVTIVGEQIFSCAIYSQQHKDPSVNVDWRRVSPEEITHKEYTLPKIIQSKCIALIKALGLQYGAIDIIKKKGNKYIFLEINADGQYGWVQYFTGMPIDEAVAYLLINKRTKGFKS